MDRLADSDNAMSLVAGLKSGDEAAVETLVRTHSGAMLRLHAESSTTMRSRASHGTGMHGP